MSGESQRQAGGQFHATRENLVLIGYRGCGKSTIGRLAARRLGWAFLDTDELIERSAGRSITEIFATGGEAVFRELEICAVQQAVSGTRRVISVGGGAVLSDANRERIRTAGRCVWLTAPPEELYRRLEADPHSAARRPALTALAGPEEVRRVLARREPLYRAVADRVVETLGRTVEDVLRDVLACLPGRPGPLEGP